MTVRAPLGLSSAMCWMVPRTLRAPAARCAAGTASPSATGKPRPQSCGGLIPRHGVSLLEIFHASLDIDGPKRALRRRVQLLVAPILIRRLDHSYCLPVPRDRDRPAVCLPDDPWRITLELADLPRWELLCCQDRSPKDELSDILCQTLWVPLCSHASATGRLDPLFAAAASPESPASHSVGSALAPSHDCRSRLLVVLLVADRGIDAFRPVDPLRLLATPKVSDLRGERSCEIRVVLGRRWANRYSVPSATLR